MENSGANLRVDVRSIGDFHRGRDNQELRREGRKTKQLDEHRYICVCSSDDPSLLPLGALGLGVFHPHEQKKTQINVFH